MLGAVIMNKMIPCLKILPTLDRILSETVVCKSKVKLLINYSVQQATASAKFFTSFIEEYYRWLPIMEQSHFICISVCVCLNILLKPPGNNLLGLEFFWATQQHQLQITYNMWLFELGGYDLDVAFVIAVFKMCTEWEGNELSCSLELNLPCYILSRIDASTECFPLRTSADICIWGITSFGLPSDSNLFMIITFSF